MSSCTIKEATVKRFHYDTHDQLRRHLDDFAPQTSSALIKAVPYTVRTVLTDNGTHSSGSCVST